MKMFTDSLQINAKAPGRTHVDLRRAIESGLDSLVKGGVVIRDTDPSGCAVWTIKSAKGTSVRVAEEFDYKDSSQRTQKAIAMTPWLCLALSLKITREADKQALMDVVAQYPMAF